MSLPLRLAIMFSPVVVWGALYLASRVGGTSLIGFQQWLKAGFVVLLGASLILFVVDRAFLSDVVAIHAWGLFGAELWITRHYKLDKLDTQQFLTSLKLSAPETTTSAAGHTDRNALDC